MRHKYITSIDWEDDFFKSLKDMGFVAEEYRYSMIKKYNTGDVLQLTFAKEKSVVVCSNWWQTVVHYRGKRRSRMRYRIMYKLNDAGWRYLKERIVAEKI